MKNITFDTTSFSEQLGIYDFFNVLLSGVIFVCGCGTVSTRVNSLLWDNMSFAKGLGLILMIYIIGMALQELGSLADRYCFKIYKGMNQSILKGTLDKNYKEKTTNKIISNPILLDRYRKSADMLIKEFISEKDSDRFENKYVSGFIFSMCQYYVSVKGNDKKVEKLRSLFAMSKTLIVCFIALAIFAAFSIVFMPDNSLIPNLTFMSCEQCSGKMLLLIVFLLISLVFYFRARRTMRNFLLILLGTYDALIRAEENEPKSAEV